MSKKTKMLQDLFHDTLKDVYFAEKKILTTLPKMIGGTVRRAGRGL
jgi:ferritin-like metal-binding protein YciE